MHGLVCQHVFLYVWLHVLCMCRCPGLAFAAALAARLQALQESDAALQLSNSFYVLNPDGDLADTQHSFEDTLKRICREVSCDPAGSAIRMCCCREHTQCHTGAALHETD